MNSNTSLLQTYAYRPYRPVNFDQTKTVIQEHRCRIEKVAIAALTDLSRNLVNGLVANPVIFATNSLLNAIYGHPLRHRFEQFCVPAILGDSGHYFPPNQIKPPFYPDRNYQNPVILNPDRKFQQFNQDKTINQEATDAAMQLTEATNLYRSIARYYPSFYPNKFDEEGRPVNPCQGNMGISGPGALWLDGPNHAGDAIIFTIHPDHGLCVFAIERADGFWAVPGGIQNLREGVIDGITRELLEETLNAVVFSRNDVVYQGYSNDWRNTTNSWIETTACARFIPWDTAKDFKIQSGDLNEVARCKWLSLKPEHLSLAGGLFASHGLLITRALENLKTEIQGASELLAEALNIQQTDGFPREACTLSALQSK